jgi:hypothetical protein
MVNICSTSVSSERPKVYFPSCRIQRLVVDFTALYGSSGCTIVLQAADWDFHACPRAARSIERTAATVFRLWKLPIPNRDGSEYGLSSFL